MSKTDTPQSMRWPVRLSATFLRMFVKRWISGTGLLRLELEGEENIPPGGALLIGNHASPFDGPILYLALQNRTFAAIAARSAYRRPVIGPYMRWAGNLRVSLAENDELTRFENIRAIRQARAILKYGGLVLLHPEGYYEDDPQILEPFQSHLLASLAYGEQIPVVPVAMWGHERYSPDYEGPWWRRWWCPFNKVTIKIGEPLWPEGRNTPENRESFVWEAALTLTKMTGQALSEYWFPGIWDEDETDEEAPASSEVK